MIMLRVRKMPCIGYVKHRSFSGIFMPHSASRPGSSYLSVNKCRRWGMTCSKVSLQTLGKEPKGCAGLYVCKIRVLALHTYRMYQSVCRMQHLKRLDSVIVLHITSNIHTENLFSR